MRVGISWRNPPLGSVRQRLIRSVMSWGNALIRPIGDAIVLRPPGTDQGDVRTLIGPKSATTTQRYAMVAPKDRAAAARLLQ